MTRAGSRCVIAYSLMGNRYHPSAGQTGVNRNRLTTGVQIVRNGFKPEDVSSLLRGGR